MAPLRQVALLCAGGLSLFGIASWDGRAGGTQLLGNPLAVLPDLVASQLPGYQPGSVPIGTAAEDVKEQSAAARSSAAAEGLVEKEQVRDEDGAVQRNYLVQQFLFGVVFFCLVVRKYRVPDTLVVSSAARGLMSESSLHACCRVECGTILLASLCAPQRAALTYHAADIMNYWIGLVAMIFCQACTVFGVSAFTDLRKKIGGDDLFSCMGACEACCCSCCVVAQEAQAVDLCTGQEVVCCGVTTRALESTAPLLNTMAIV